MLLAYPTPNGDASVFPAEGPRWPLARADEGFTVDVPERGHTLYFAPTGHSAADVFSLAAVADRNGHRIDFDYAPDGTLVEVRHSGGYRIAVEVADGHAQPADGMRSINGMRSITRFPHPSGASPGPLPDRRRGSGPDRNATRLGGDAGTVRPGGVTAGRHFAVTGTATVDELAEAATVPLSVIVQVAKRCNFDCSFCSETLQLPDPTLTELDTIRANLAGVQRVFLSGGEPLLRKDFGEIVDMYTS
jgi:uncharacterized radical SAM superfamily Fe-S cluster-containing enzyme